MQGLAALGWQTMLYGKILSCTGLSISEFSYHLPYPCTFIHDGARCYCGRQGCMKTLLSLESLLKENETLEKRVFSVRRVRTMRSGSTVST